MTYAGVVNPADDWLCTAWACRPQGYPPNGGTAGLCTRVIHSVDNHILVISRTCVRSNEDKQGQCPFTGLGVEHPRSLGKQCTGLSTSCGCRVWRVEMMFIHRTVHTLWKTPGRESSEVWGQYRGWKTGFAAVGSGDAEPQLLACGHKETRPQRACTLRAGGEGGGF